MRNAFNEKNEKPTLIESEQQTHSATKAFEDLNECGTAENLASLKEYIANVSSQNKLSEVLEFAAQYDQYMTVIAGEIQELDAKISALADESLTQQKIVDEARSNYASTKSAIDLDAEDDPELENKLEEYKMSYKTANINRQVSDAQRVIYQADRIIKQNYYHALEEHRLHVRKYITHLGAIAIHAEVMEPLANIAAIPAPPKLEKGIPFGSIDFSEVDDGIDQSSKDHDGVMSTQKKRTFKSIPVDTFTPPPREVPEAVEPSLAEILSSIDPPQLKIHRRLTAQSDSISKLTNM